MGDFYQDGVITTLHNLKQRSTADLEAELEEFAAERPMTLILPSLFSELERPALKTIVSELSQVRYIGEIVIGLDRADQDQYRYALDYFSKLPQHHRILWNDGPRLRAIDRELAAAGLAPTEAGKGRNVWYCIGQVIGSGRAGAVALHDCDITTYTRDMPARLFYPVANPAFSYAFCKGYYARVAGGKIHGRVCRLLVTPLVRTLQRVCGPSPYLEFIDGFRYALAGEFSMQEDVLHALRIPGDWGLEIGVLSEMQRNYSPNRICQVDIADTYDHKHQNLSADEAEKGLSRMSTDIAKAFFRKLATQGAVFSEGTFRTIKATYYRSALDFVERFHTLSVMNGLKYDRHTEEKAVELFAENIIRAGQSFLEAPMETPFIPSWNRVRAAFPDVLERINQAVEADLEEFGGAISE